MRVLAIHSSGRIEQSSSRQLVDSMAQQYAQTGATVETLDLVANPPSVITPDWIDAGNQSPQQWKPSVASARAESDRYIDQLKDTDVLMIGAPIYNFAIPGALKLWIDQICRGRSTFRYTSDGPVGMLNEKRAIVVISSGALPLMRTTILSRHIYVMCWTLLASNRSTSCTPIDK